MDTKELDELEKDLKAGCVASRETVLELIAAARELGELKSAMSFLNDGQRCGSAILACDRILAWAIEAGWEQTK